MWVFPSTIIYWKTHVKDDNFERFMRNDNVKNISGNAGTRAFVSGDFSQQGLKENLDGLSLKDIQGIAGWVDFYHQQYTYIGSVIRKSYITTGMIVQMKRM